jgi:hypothetical protein
MTRVERKEEGKKRERNRRRKRERERNGVSSGETGQGVWK